MDKIILNDKTELEINYKFGLNITLSNKTIDELEEIFTSENLKSVEFITNNQICGKYENLELVSLSKNYITKEITVLLKEINITQ